MKSRKHIELLQKNIIQIYNKNKSEAEKKNAEEMFKKCSEAYDVLRTLPEVDDILARAIIEERELIEDDEPQPFTSVEDLFERIEGLDDSIRNMISVVSEYFRITSVDRVNNIDVRIWCIAYMNNGKLEILRWCEEP